MTSKREHERYIRDAVIAVCERHVPPNGEQMQSLKEAGYGFEHIARSGLDGLKVTHGDDEPFFVCVKPRGLSAPKIGESRKARTFRYEWGDIVHYFAADEMLAKTNIDGAIEMLDGIGSKDLKNRIEEGIEHISHEIREDERKMEADMGKKLKKGSAYIIVRTSDKRHIEARCVSGYLFTVECTDGNGRERACTLFAHKMDDNGLWNVTEPVSGASVTAGHPTRCRAIAAATDDGILRRMADAMGTYGYRALIRASQALMQRGSAMRIADYEKMLKRYEKEEYAEEHGGEAGTPKPEETAFAVTLDTMREWCAAHENVVATQAKGAGAVVKIHGESAPYKDELKDMGFKWSRKGFWWAKPAA